MPQNAVHSRRWDFPNAEKTENVVDSVGVEVTVHLCQTPPPPSVAILRHPLPIVGGEAPILTILREEIGRRTCLTVKVIEFEGTPRVNAATANANRQIAFQNYAATACVSSSLAQLAVEFVLHIAPESYVGIVWRIGPEHLAHFTLRIIRKFAPTVEIACAVFVAQRTECRVRLKPFGALFYKLLKILIINDFVLTLTEHRTAIIEFQFYDALVINIQPIVKSPRFIFKLFLLLIICKFSNFENIKEKRIERKHRNCIVWVRIEKRIC